jgi:hypothetical protein
VVLTVLMRLLPAPLLLAGSLAALLGTPAVAATPLCFEKLSGRAGQLDVEQLRLDRDGQRLTGFYRWIPWQKDRRVGRLEGRVSSPGTARVLYRFSQEGQQEQAPLTIAFSSSQARISWDKTAQTAHGAQPLPPPVLLPSRSCAQLKPVPGL